MGPGRYPQYTRADFGPEAVGSSNHKHDTSPNVKPFGRVKSRIISSFFDFLMFFIFFFIFQKKKFLLFFFLVLLSNMFNCWR